MFLRAVRLNVMWVLWGRKDFRNTMKKILRMANPEQELTKLEHMARIVYQNQAMILCEMLQIIRDTFFEYKLKRPKHTFKHILDI